MSFPAIRALFAVCVAGASLLPAQDKPQDPTIQVLLNEVRLLRVALERSNQFNPRIQIALARMQFQEERVRGATRLVESARNDITNLQFRKAEHADHIREVEARVGQATDPNIRRDFEQRLAQLKVELERLNTLDQQLRAQEAEKNSVLLNEQGKWNEVNDLLMNLERSLSAPPPAP